MPEPAPYRRILALVHFDEHDGLVAGKASLLAQQNQAELVLLHLIEPDGGLDGGYFGGEVRTTARVLEQAALRRLQFLAATLGIDGARCDAQHGPRRQRLSQYIDHAHPDLIVAGEAHAYLVDACDTLILSPGKRPRGGHLLMAFLNWLGVRMRIAGV